MIVSITSIAHDVSLLPYFLHHYRNLGVQRFFFAVTDNALSQLPQQEICDLLGREPDVIPVTSAEFAKMGAWGHARWETDVIRKQLTQHGDWVIPADLDEFNEYPLPLPQLIAEMDRGGGGNPFDGRAKRSGCPQQNARPFAGFQGGCLPLAAIPPVVSGYSRHRARRYEQGPSLASPSSIMDRSPSTGH